VLARIRDDLGSSDPTVMEISHRGAAFDRIAGRTEELLRSLLAVPDDFAVLFVQGGATAQFAAAPLNLVPDRGTADHVVTGAWSARAAAEASRFCRVSIVADNAPGRRTIPDPGTWRTDPAASYLAIAMNETIDGVEFGSVPDAGGVPIVCDASSTLMSRPVDVSSFGVLYGGTQKNLGIAGLTVVLVRRSLLGRSGREVPAVLDWAALEASSSRLNTPPTFTWYVTGLVLEWIEGEGGLAEMARRSRARMESLYSAIDASSLYTNDVDPACRSWTNVPFRVGDGSRDDAFLAGAAEAGLVGLRGHRSVGGMRASLYNAMPQDGVDELIAYMADFEAARA
jgi:phosphoserine aminotransferase